MILGSKYVRAILNVLI